MTRFFKDPLVHFLVIGAALFAIAAWRGESISAGREQIVVTAEQVTQLRDAASLLQGGRALTDDEIAALVEPAIRDEVLYREALALGLDVNDDEVRRRLIEKMSYLTQDIADPEPGSEAELRGFYDELPARFEIPELVTFDQVFFSPGSRGDALQADAEAGIAQLREGRAPADVGDRTPLRESYESAPREQVAVLFGDELADAVFTLPPGDWTGPYTSDFGLHAVRLRARTDRRLPPFDEIREQVQAEFAAQRRRERNAADYERMRARYDIVVEKPVAADTSGAGAAAQSDAVEPAAASVGAEPDPPSSRAQ
jgi:peptidyl-prolyl cis-trans isomerase C